MSVQKTYNVFRQVKENAGNVRSFTSDPQVSFTPAIIDGALGVIESSSVKTVKDSMDEFFSLFTREQADILREKTDYNGWLNIVKEKNKLPMDKLNSVEELEQVQNLIA
jgi:hypothetical protein